MRTFPRALRAPYPLLLALAVSGLLAGSPAHADEEASEPRPVREQPAPQAETKSQTGALSLSELKAKLDRSDQVAALHALHLALNHTADGDTFVWNKRDRILKGVIRPTAAFRNADGLICRHVIYALALGRYRKQIELVACREGDGRWRL